MENRCGEFMVLQEKFRVRLRSPFFIIICVRVCVDVLFSLSNKASSRSKYENVKRQLSRKAKRELFGIGLTQRKRLYTKWGVGPWVEEKTWKIIKKGSFLTPYELFSLEFETTEKKDSLRYFLPLFP